MQIGQHDTSERVFVVAEIGNNHEGDVGRAKEMVERAADTGVDAVKFQTFKTEWFTSGADPARVARLKGFELTYDQFADLSALARARGLYFMSTPFDLESARFLLGICDALKIASGDNDYWDLIRVCAEAPLPLIASTGMTSLEDVERLAQFVGALRASSTFALLHCVSAYPAPPEQANLRAIPRIADRVSCEVGYSDHTLGIDACQAAVALGARILEKHFTLDKALSDFRDHRLSADPAEMTELVRRVRLVESLLGTGIKELQPGEHEVAGAARRSASAARDLRAGERLAQEDLIFLRPGTGVRPGAEGRIMGRELVRDVPFGTLLVESDFR